MKHLLIVAHGSRNPLAISEVESLAAVLTNTLAENYAGASACFLEIAPPSIAGSCAALVKNGATAIDVYPLFLNSGKHASQDIPETVAAMQNSYPNIDFKLLETFGKASGLQQFIANHILTTA